MEQPEDWQETVEVLRGICFQVDLCSVLDHKEPSRVVIQGPIKGKGVQSWEMRRHISAQETKWNLISGGPARLVGKQEIL